MTLKPVGPYLLVTLDPTVSESSLWRPERELLGAPATVTAVGTLGESLAVGDRVLVSTRRLIQVGTAYLIPETGVLAALG